MAHKKNGTWTKPLGAKARLNPIHGHQQHAKDLPDKLFAANRLPIHGSAQVGIDCAQRKVIAQR